MRPNQISSPGVKWETQKGRGIRIMGVDPGLEGTGYGVVEEGTGGSFAYCGSGVISTLASHPLADRLQKIFHGLQEEIARYSPQFMAVESPFFAKNVKTALLLGQARGVTILAAAMAGIRVAEFSPLEVKQAVVGYGRAAKEQIQTMVRSLLQIPDIPNTHAADALGVALCLGHSLSWQNSLAAAGKRSCNPGKRGYEVPRKIPVKGGE